MRNFDIVEVDGCKFYVCDQINSIQRVKGNPWFANMRPDDVAVDLGANIGAITIPLAKSVGKVYAVEPLYYEELERNVMLNDLRDVTVLKVGIGKEIGEREIQFAGRVKTVPIVQFRGLHVAIKEQIDFLKMDIEGAEWSIEPEELKGIRELRIEFHIRRGHCKEHRQNLQRWFDWMDREGYEKVVEHPHYGLDPYDKEDYMVRASLR